MVEHPEFFERRFAASSDNLEILLSAKCAAFELRSRNELFGPGTGNLCSSRSGSPTITGAWHWTGHLSADTSLRAVTAAPCGCGHHGEPWSPRSFSERLNDATQRRSTTWAQYQVSGSIMKRKAYVRRVDCDYFSRYRLHPGEGAGRFNLGRLRAGGAWRGRTARSWVSKIKFC
jgi:hypothetical protein